MPEKNKLLTAEIAKEKLHRLALEIAENLEEDTQSILLIGIKKNGMAIAQSIQVFLQRYISIAIDIREMTFDKTDLRISNISGDNDFSGKHIILIDDVSNSGRTLLYALKPLLEHQPLKIQTLVMVERMHKLYPIQSDYVGLSIATTQHDYVSLEVEDGKVVAAFIENQ
ncbi:MAG: phosphoribosyltransferase [Pseudopedobacter saltans]|uniref:Phosphoribosyltransferase n=1 Tax=Pseudopedobacter saltans TaxID=151895 RepID=A0A2W5GDL4_9SPHI|nr:MAG: phosphoribosyltransferase [Pseudopedobacter saltans]